MNDRPRPPLISAGWVVSLLLLAGLLCVASWVLREFGVRNVNPAVAVVGLPVLIVVGGLVLLGVALTVSAVRRRRALDRERRGLCSRCGYDLRGTRHELCPECGLLVLRRRDPVTGKELD